MSTEQTVSPKAVAMRLGISDKRLRGWIRSEHRNGRTLKGFVPVGQGNRYAPSKAEAEALFKAFVKAHPSHKLPKGTQRAPKAPKATPTQAHAPEAIVTPEAIEAEGNGDADA